MPVLSAHLFSQPLNRLPIPNQGTLFQVFVLSKYCFLLLLSPPHLFTYMSRISLVVIASLKPSLSVLSKHRPFSVKLDMPCFVTLVTRDCDVFFMEMSLVHIGEWGQRCRAVIILVCAIVPGTQWVLRKVGWITESLTDYVRELMRPRPGHDFGEGGEISRRPKR